MAGTTRVDSDSGCVAESKTVKWLDGVEILIRLEEGRGPWKQNKSDWRSWLGDALGSDKPKGLGSRGQMQVAVRYWKQSTVWPCSSSKAEPTLEKAKRLTVM